MRVAVLGVGLIGGSVGLAARERAGAEVSGFDPEPERLERAAEVGAVDRPSADLAGACEGAEVVVCAAPVSVLAELAADALAAAPAGAVVTDVGSVKRPLVAALADEPRFIGGHPLAGAETAGVEHARADLFDGARWYLTPTERAEGIGYDRLQRLIADLGARPQAIDAEAHDRLMAAVSHVPHAVANALAAEAAGSVAGGDDGEGGAGRPAQGSGREGRLPEVGPSFRDATRVAGANPAIWRDIFTGNRDTVAAGIDAIARRLAEAAELIRSGDPDAIERWHRAAGEARRELLEGGLPGGELVELRVRVPNRPGIVAELALALGEAGVNIEDMGLHPVEDMSSGAISLFIAGESEAARAERVVAGLGHDISRVAR